MKLVTKFRVLTISVLLSLNSFGFLFGQAVCPNVQVSYSCTFTSDDTAYGCPESASYADGTKVPQSKDSNGNLLVTWPKIGVGIVAYLFTNGVDIDIEYFTVNIGIPPTFTTHPSVMCHSQTSTYTISDPCNDPPYTWAVAAGWSINGGGNTLTTSSTSVNITAPSTGTNSVQLTATTSYGSAVTTSIWLSGPFFNSISIDGGSSPVPLCGGGDYISYTAGQAHVISTTVSGASSVAFALSGGSGSVNGSAISATSYEFESSSGSASFSITMTVSNSCGSFSQCLPFLNSSSGGGSGGGTGGGGGGGGCNSYSVSPNPSSSKLSVIVPDKLPPCSASVSQADLSTNDVSYQTAAPAQENTLTIQSVSLYSSDGQPQLTKLYNDGTKSIDLDISGLKKGIYILKVSDGGSHSETHRVVIN